MKHDFFTNLPSEIITNILSRLPIKAIARGKCVCKPWLHLLQSNDFVNSHLSESTLTLAVLKPKTDSSSCTIFEFDDGQDLEQHDHHYNPLTEFDFPHVVEIRGSANGLLFLSLSYGSYKSEPHYVCNPITRAYIEVSFPKELIHPRPEVVNYPETIGESLYAYPQSVTYGFGVSKVTGQYKVVRIYHDSVVARGGHGGPRTIPRPECHVHTLGTGLWRSIQHDALFEYGARISCVFLNGNLHWIVSDSESVMSISCFDLETECFSSFSTAPGHVGSFELPGALSALGDCLCLCDHSKEDETVIWLMKEYGDEKSWTKEYVINIDEELDIEGFELVYPLKVFEDGDVLMLREDRQLFYYSKKTEITGGIGMFGEELLNAILLTPSFVSLKSLGMENVISF